MSAPPAARAVAALSCPSCAGPVTARSVGAADCPSCATPLAVLGPDPPRSVVEPALGAEQATAALQAHFAGRPVPPAFRDPSRWRAPRLTFAACWVVERTSRTEKGRLVETIDAGPAVRLPGDALDALPFARLLGPRSPYDPVALRSRGAVLDPAQDRRQSAPRATRSTALDERAEIVYAPLYLMELPLGRNVYELVVCALTGRVLGGRAPLDPTARVPHALAIVYGLALVAAMMPHLFRLLFWVVLKLEIFGFVLVLLAAGGLLSGLAWAWDQLRFRHEILVEAGELRTVPINRPEQTMPEKARGLLVRAARLVGGGK